MPISATPSAAEINVELGRAANAPFSINGAEERALADVPSGPIAFSDFIGKSAVTPYTALIGFEYGLRDNYAGTWVNEGTGVISQAQAKFGANSFESKQVTNNNLRNPNLAGLAFPNGTEFTIDCWVWLNSGQGPCFVWDMRTGTPATGALSVYQTGGTLALYNGNSLLLQTPAAVLSPNTWTHIALTRGGDPFQARLFVNGIQQGNSIGVGAVGVGANGFYFGSTGAGTGNTWGGYLDELRIDNTTAWWTANFTPPDAPYPAPPPQPIAVVNLLAAKDLAANSTGLNRSPGSSWGTQTPDTDWPGTDYKLSILLTGDGSPSITGQLQIGIDQPNLPNDDSVWSSLEIYDTVTEEIVWTALRSQYTYIANVGSNRTQWNSPSGGGNQLLAGRNYTISVY